jgi:hypothetical protein
MKKITILLLAIQFFACKDAKKRPVEVKEKTESSIPATVPSTSKFPVSSGQFSRYLQKDAETGDFSGNWQGISPVPFQTSDAVAQVLESDFPARLSPENKYYVVDSFVQHEARCRIIMYPCFIESNVQAINTRLDVLGADGTIAGSLLLDSRFNSETEYFREFSISSDGEIDIRKYEVAHFEVNENGDIKPKKQPDTTIRKVTYLLDSSGRFSKK